MKEALHHALYSSNLERTEFLLDRCERSFQGYRGEKKQLTHALEHQFNPGIESFGDDVRRDLQAVRREFYRVVDSWRSMVDIVEEQQRNGIGVGNQKTRDEVIRRIVELGGLLGVDTSKIPKEYGDVE